jgi:hypothetical protein
MNDDKLDQLLSDAMRVQNPPDLWRRVAPVASEPSWKEIRWACAVGLAVLMVWTALPRSAQPQPQTWEPVALKAKLRADTMTASMER